MMRLIRIILLSVLLWTPLSAGAAHITVFNAFIDGNQANAGAGTGSPGIGAATMTLDQNTNEFSWFVAWQDLISDVTAAHFHGPAMPGQNAGVEVPIDHTANPSIGSAILNGAQVADLLAGLWYINIHTMMDPGGAIRGQVLAVRPIPLPAAVWLMIAALASFGGLARRR